jgi:polyisoprenoid-binding protein YceI
VFRSFIVCFLLTLSGLPLAAQEMVAALNPGQTQINFTVGSVLHTVHGTFKLKRGELRFDPATGAASGQIVVDVASGESGNGSRDRRMHKEILESQKYPEAVFTAGRVQGRLAPSGESRLELLGTFRIHGEDHEMTASAVVIRNGDDLTATVRFVVPYLKWGMKNPSTFILRVEDHVDVDVKAAVHLASGNSSN